jgi:hypothetical protein
MEIQGRQVTLTRKELYEQVWTTPMRKLAPTYGLSDVGLTKVCKKYNIPTPPRGYWAKKAFGKRVKQIPLPPQAEGSSELVSLAHDPDPKPRQFRPASYPVSDPDLLERYLYEKDPEHQIAVPDSLRNPHPIIQRTREAIRSDRRPDLYNHVGPDHPAAQECATISVARESLPRALRLMNCLFQGLESRGHQVVVRSRASGYGNRVRCLMVGEEFAFVLREKTKMVRVPRKGQRHSLYSSDEVRYEPNGLFELRIMGQYSFPEITWVDGKERRLEDRLNQIIIDMLVLVEKRRRGREERQRQETARLQREQEQREQERLRQIERARAEQFEALAGRWRKAETLRLYLEAVKEDAIRRFGQVEPGSGLGQWLEWAAKHIRAIDPLMAADLPVIDVD